MTRNLNIALSDDDDEINAINLIIVDIFAVDIYGVTYRVIFLTGPPLNLLSVGR